MKRTTVRLPADLEIRARRRAGELGVSLGELVRRALERGLDEGPLSPPEDALYADRVLADVTTPGDVAERHDDYLNRY